MDYRNVIFNEDCLTTINRMKNDGIKVDLVVTSPPYNKNAYSSKSSQSKSWSSLNGRCIPYDVYDDDMPQEQYEAWQRDVIQGCLDILKPSGSIFYNHKDIQFGGRIVAPKWVYAFNVHQQIIWDRGSSMQNDPHYFQPITEYIYWIVKNTSKFYFDKSKSIFRNNIWRINPDKNPHPAPFPLILVGNIIKCCTDGGDFTVYDPFMGSGTTAIGCIRNGCNYIGSEISSKYVDMANKRIYAETSQLTLF